jgi:hypothetical protein
MDRNQRRLLDVDTRRLRPGSGFHAIGFLVLCLLLSPPSAVEGVQTHSLPAAQKQQRQATGGSGRRITKDHHATEEDRSDDGKYVYYPLPRIEIQFMCGHDIRPDFAATDAVQQYYVDVFLSQVEDYNPNDETFELKAAVSISDVGDVKDSQWFYPLCNQSSTDVLVTMDVSGYFGLRGEEERVGDMYRSSPSDVHLIKNTTWYAINHMDRRVGTHSLREYFHEHICRGDDLVFFQSNTLPWNDPLSRPDSPPHQHIRSSEPPTTTTADPPYPSINNPSFFDHNLYLLCGGADDILEGEELPDSSFVVLGLFVGMVMVGMIFTELKAPVGGLRDPAIGNRDGYVIRPTRELEMV